VNNNLAMVYLTQQEKLDEAERLAALFRAIPFARIFAIEHETNRSIGGGDTRQYGDTAVTFLR